MSVDIATYVHDLAVAAKAASASLATASDEQRQEAVRAMAAALRNGVDSIVAANELDMSAARDAVLGIKHRKIHADGHLARKAVEHADDLLPGFHHVDLRLGRNADATARRPSTRMSVCGGSA